MRLIILGTSAVLMVVLGAPTAPSAAGALPGRAVGTTATSSYDTDLEGQVVRLTNRARAHRGCQPLRSAPALAYAAGRHSVLMARHVELSHRLAGEPSLLARTAEAGFRGAQLVGENLAVGYRSASGVVTAWMRSPGHRAIILDCRFREIGVGTLVRAGRRWWTMDVGRR